ncbi:helix-turn-helix domain-containing protein [Streptomyces sp. NPDC016459]|uniref:helix-turn-helix domain-containing protein n=1 Tax=Streptomyces sp. NPDC016459 TaxID=3157190 RepID=UPI0033DBD904
MATPTLTVEERRTRVHQLHKAGHSNRAIGRELGIHHVTVGRILSATPAPEAAPPAPTSGDAGVPPMHFNLTRELIQDLNVLADKKSGDLPAPLVRAIHAAADRRRAEWMHQLHQLATTSAQP